MTNAESVAKDLRASLLQDVAALPDDELLALAYTFSHSSERLRVYLELFRGRAGERAQFAACLICFDLAQKGDALMASQFAFLQGTLSALSRNENLVQHLVNQQPYLYGLWTQCSQTLSGADGPSSTAHDAPGTAETFGFLRAQDAPIAGSLDLLGDDDLEASALEVDEEAMWTSYVQACEHFFGGGAHLASYDGSMGFRFRGHHGQARAQAFDQALEHCQAFVAPARGMRPLLLLAWGLSLKPRGLLGQPNKRRQHLIIAGLQSFVSAHDEVASVIAVLGPLYADADIWPSIANLLTHYNRFIRQRFAGFDAVDHAAWAETFISEDMPQ